MYYCTPDALYNHVGWGGVFTLFGLLTWKASRDRCRGKLRFLYPYNEILLQFSWTLFPVNHNKWPFKRLTMTRDTIQYETKLFPRLSLLTPLLILIHFPLHILSVVFSWHYRHSLTCALVHLKVTSASLRLYLNWEALGGVLCSREPWLHTHAEQAFWGQCEIFCEPVPCPTWHLITTSLSCFTSCCVASMALSKMASFRLNQENNH